MIETIKGKEARDHIKRVLTEISDMVTPTMGAKGMNAMLSEEFDRPTLTDDGVTVAKMARLMKGFDLMVAHGAMEAAHNTEKVAYDGTTLTILLVKEFYEAGFNMIESGMHPQVVADLIAQEAEYVVKNLERFDLEPEQVLDIANISTKIPRLGNIIYEAYKLAGDGMNVMTEHDRNLQSGNVVVEHDSGYGMDSGFMSEAMKPLCNESDRTIFEDARMIMLKEGIMTNTMMTKFFGSVPADERQTPMVFCVDPKFNPEALRLIIDTIVQNNLQAQFLFINEAMVDDVFLDLAELSGGKIQDATSGITEYKWEHTGLVKKIIIEIDKTTIVSENRAEGRIAYYKNKLAKDKFNLNKNHEVLMQKRLGALDKGVVKIKIGAASVIEFKTLKLKLDDGIGAVRKAIQDGYVYGAGKALYNISNLTGHLQEALKKPAITIVENSGNKFDHAEYSSASIGLNVKTSTYVVLPDEGIIDSYTSVTQAVENAASIATSYLRTYTLIQKKEKA